MIEDLRTSPYLSFIQNPDIGLEEKYQSICACDLNCETASIKYSNVYVKIASAIWDPQEDRNIPLNLSWINSQHKLDPCNE